MRVSAVIVATGASIVQNEPRKLVTEKIGGRMAEAEAKNLRAVEGAGTDSQDLVGGYLATLGGRL